jgi:hypothetical protein
MTHRRVVAVALWLLAFGLAGSREAAAQTGQPLQLGAGYQFLHESLDRLGQNFPIGAYAEIERAITADEVKTWDWMGQFEAGFRSDNGFSEQLYTVLGGIRLASAKHLRWTPSGFGLIGLATQNASCADLCAGTDNGIALQGGFTMSTRVNQSTLIDITFKATKLKVDSDGVFNAAVAGGVRFNLRK